VTLYAKVTYNNAPVANKEVAFEIHGPLNQYQNITVYRQAFTNASGIATVNFRIPWPDQNAEAVVFGNWTILAKVDIAEQWVSDSHWFYVHWIIDITNVDVSPTTVTRGQDTANINVTIENWAMTPRNATITTVIYDELGVPIGTWVVTVHDIPGMGQTETPAITYVASGISIPSWAYVGTGNVYANAFTKLPWECGVCYCPEASTIIIIHAP
jgi:hypothetical protein